MRAEAKTVVTQREGNLRILSIALHLDEEKGKVLLALQWFNYVLIAWVVHSEISRWLFLLCIPESDEGFTNFYVAIRFRLR